MNVTLDLGTCLVAQGSIPHSEKIALGVARSYQARGWLAPAERRVVRAATQYVAIAKRHETLGLDRGAHALNHMTKVLRAEQSLRRAVHALNQLKRQSRSTAT
jgi:hypothetical protein